MVIMLCVLIVGLMTIISASVLLVENDRKNTIADDGVFE